MGLLRRIEQRASVENPAVSLASPEAFSIIFGDGMKAATGVQVTTEKALGVPAIWAAVNFIAGTIAGLPLVLYRTSAEGRLDVARRDPLYSLLHDVVNEDKVTSFRWRKQMMVSTLTEGRSFTYIERNAAGRPANFWPLPRSTVTVKRANNRTTYEVKDGGAATKTYDAGEIIDIPFLVLADGVSYLAPFTALRNAIGLAIAMEEYASRFFQGGGVPPLALEGPPASPGAVRRATGQMEEAVKTAYRENRNVLYMPDGHKLTPIGFKPEDGQLTEARLFQLQEAARIYSLPPVFLQDLSRGTYTNSEQQDLHFVKHTLTQWLKLWEQELNAKLFGARNTSRFVEFKLDALLRGDFAARMNGYAQAIQNAILTPNEARDLENRPAMEGGDKLYINTASQSLDGPQMNGETTQPPAEDGNGGAQGEGDEPAQ